MNGALKYIFELPPPPLFFITAHCKGLPFSRFGSADSKGLTDTICGTADSKAIKPQEFNHIDREAQGEQRHREQKPGARSARSLHQCPKKEARVSLQKFRDKSEITEG